MNTMTATEVCDFLQISFEQLRQLRQRRDGTKFPPPLLGDAGLSWYEADVCDWVCFVQDWTEAGGTAEALESLITPHYLSTEPEFRRVKAAKE